MTVMQVIYVVSPRCRYIKYCKNEREIKKERSREREREREREQIGIESERGRGREWKH